MIKQILTFSLAVFLCACAGGQIKQLPPEARAVKKVDFFAAGHTQAAFKVTGTLNNAGLEGVLIIKKIGEEDFDVSVLTGGAYRVLQATATPDAIAYRYLFPDADTPLIRGRITQFLNLLLFDPGLYQRRRVTKEGQMLAYKAKTATVHLLYRAQDVYPYAAKTITMLNAAELFYDEYAPANETNSVQVPHELVYKDGKIEVTLALISLK